MEGNLRWPQSLAHTTSSSGETEIAQDSPLNAFMASGRLGLRGYMLWLAQATLETQTMHTHAGCGPKFFYYANWPP